MGIEGRRTCSDVYTKCSFNFEELRGILQRQGQSISHTINRSHPSSITRMRHIKAVMCDSDVTDSRTYRDGVDPIWLWRPCQLWFLLFQGWHLIFLELRKTVRSIFSGQRRLVKNPVKSLVQSQAQGQENLYTRNKVPVGSTISAFIRRLLHFWQSLNSSWT